MNLIGNINAIPFRRFRGGGGVAPFPSIPGMIARYSALGLTNEQMAENPVWKDLTGNGHDLQMKNFAWKEGSGISDVYLGALVFDGVDDYGVCDNFPILTKEKGYTVVALRRFIYDGVDRRYALMTNADPNGIKDGFILELVSPNSNKYTDSFGSNTILSGFEKSVFTYQTSKYYNGAPIKIGEKLAFDKIAVGTRFYPNYDPANVAIWEICILDHDATEEELTKIKDYFVKTYPWLFPDQAWTVVGKTNEDEDRATIANITGNGNNLVLSNLGFAGNSGYGEYAYNWNKWGVSNGDATNVSKQYNKFVAVMPVNQSISTCSLYSTEVSTGTKFQFKLKITGLTTNWTVRVMEKYTEGANIIYEFDKDGTYQIDHTMTGSGNQLRLYIRMYCAVPNTEGTTVTIEQIPEYEGYLITDGVDDKIVSSVFGMGKDFTIVGDWKFIDNKKSGTGLVKASSFYIYNTMIGLDLYINSGSVTNRLDGIKSINAACSDGRVYDRNWNEILVNTGNAVGSGGILEVSSSGGRFDRIAFKNLAIYPRILSKDECIKAYNYLQTLKAK